MTTKPQKIEGGRKENIKNCELCHKENNYGVCFHDDYYRTNNPLLHLRMTLSEEQKVSLDVLLKSEAEKAVASERQRCVEAYGEAEALGKYCNYLKTFIPKDATYTDFGRWSQKFRKGNDSATDQAKHDLEQLK